MNRKQTVKKTIFIILLSILTTVLYWVDVLMAEILASNISWEFMEKYIPLFFMTVSIIFLLLSMIGRGGK